MQRTKSGHVVLAGDSWPRAYVANTCGGVGVASLTCRFVSKSQSSGLCCAGDVVVRVQGSRASELGLSGVQGVLSMVSSASVRLDIALPSVADVPARATAVVWSDTQGILSGELYVRSRGVIKKWMRRFFRFDASTGMVWRYHSASEAARRPSHGRAVSVATIRSVRELPASSTRFEFVVQWCEGADCDWRHAVERRFRAPTRLARRVWVARLAEATGLTGLGADDLEVELKTASAAPSTANTPPRQPPAVATDTAAAAAASASAVAASMPTPAAATPAAVVASSPSPSRASPPPRPVGVSAELVTMQAYGHLGTANRTRSSSHTKSSSGAPSSRGGKVAESEGGVGSGLSSDTTRSSADVVTVYECVRVFSLNALPSLDMDDQSPGEGRSTPESGLFAGAPHVLVLGSRVCEVNGLLVVVASPPASSVGQHSTVSDPLPQGPTSRTPRVAQKGKESVTGSLKRSLLSRFKRPQKAAGAGANGAAEPPKPVPKPRRMSKCLVGGFPAPVCDRRFLSFSHPRFSDRGGFSPRDVGLAPFSDKVRDRLLPGSRVRSKLYGMSSGLRAGDVILSVAQQFSGGRGVYWVRVWELRVVSVGSGCCVSRWVMGACFTFRAWLGVHYAVRRSPADVCCAGWVVDGRCSSCGTVPIRRCVGHLRARRDGCPGTFTTADGDACVWPSSFSCVSLRRCSCCSIDASFGYSGAS